LWYENNKEKSLKRNRQFYKNNKEQQLKLTKKYYREHKEELTKNCRTRYENNKEEKLNQNREWQRTHRNQINKRKRDRIKTDINFRLTINLRSRFKSVVKGINKSKSSLKLIGCSVEQLKQHLESNFVDGMSWDNYGEWHIDHLRPCCSFDLTKLEEQRKCFNFSNLQPLWAKDNQSKGGKY